MSLLSLLRCCRCCCGRGTRPLSRAQPALSFELKRPLSSQSTTSKSSNAPHVAIVGTGPSGFYVGQFLQKAIPNLALSFFEKMPTPYGLARYGVAPDHPEVKNCTTQFEAVATNPNTSVFANTTIGDQQPNSDLTVSDLRDGFDAVVLSHGSTCDRQLNIEGSSLGNVVDAGAFVGWYNGDPHHVALDIDLSGKTAVVIGQGNVALDCARLMVCPYEHIQPTDITSSSAHRLSNAHFENVHVVGRRGPIEAAFTTKEMRELSRIPGVVCMIGKQQDSTFSPVSFSDEENAYINSNRPLKRKMKLLQSFGGNEGVDSAAQVHLDFFLSPVKFLPKAEEDCVGGVLFDVMELDGDFSSGRKAVRTGKTIEMAADLVITSIGRVGTSIDSSIPFNTRLNHIEHQEGRVVGVDDVYCSGWVKTGPVGTIATTLADAQRTALVIASDLKKKMEGSDSAQSIEEKKRSREEMLKKIRGKVMLLVCVYVQMFFRCFYFHFGLFCSLLKGLVIRPVEGHRSRGEERGEESWKSRREDH
eukprot:m.121838 g.121838  ORF g.121838 m.121838 type:complete len:530 (+) comp12929_c1_seq10:74-1663(+)